MTTQPEVTISWFNASSNDGTHCFDVQKLSDGTIQTRNSTNPGVVTDYTPGEWEYFIAGVKAGTFDHTL